MQVEAALARTWRGMQVERDGERERKIARELELASEEGNSEPGFEIVIFVTSYLGHAEKLSSVYFHIPSRLLSKSIDLRAASNSAQPSWSSDRSIAIKDRRAGTSAPLNYQKLDISISRCEMG